MPREDLSDALLAAAESGNKKMVIKLLDQGADINTSWNDGANEVNVLTFFERSRQSQQDILVAAAIAQTDKGEDWKRFVAGDNVQREMLSVISGKEAQFLCVVSPSLESKLPLSSLSFSSRAKQKGFNNYLFGEGVHKEYYDNMAIGGIAGLAANMRNVSTFLAANLSEGGLCDQIIQKFDEKNPDQPLDRNKLRYLRSFSELAVDYGDDRGPNYAFPVKVTHELIFGHELKRYLETEVASAELLENFSEDVLDEIMEVHTSHAYTPPLTRVNTPEGTPLENNRGGQLFRG